jgi:hypothetical protein
MHRCRVSICHAMREMPQMGHPINDSLPRSRLSAYDGQLRWKKKPDRNKEEWSGCGGVEMLVHNLWR